MEPLPSSSRREKHLKEGRNHTTNMAAAQDKAIILITITIECKGNEETFILPEKLLNPLKVITLSIITSKKI